MSAKCGRANGIVCTLAKYNVRSGRIRKRPGSENNAGSSTPAEEADFSPSVRGFFSSSI